MCPGGAIFQLCASEGLTVSEKPEFGFNAPISMPQRIVKHPEWKITDGRSLRKGATGLVGSIDHDTEMLPEN